MKKYLLILAIYFILIVIFSPKHGFLADQYTIGNWTKIFMTNGIWNAYKESNINYPPITLYVIYLYGSLASSLHLDVVENVFLSKYFFIVFDIGSFIIVLKILKRFNIKFSKIFLGLANLSLIYNSAFWGQFDSVYTFFGLLSIYLALENKFFLALASLILAINSKPQAIIFIPILFLLFIPYLKHNIKNTPKLILTGIFIQIAIFLPFILHSNGLDYLSVINHTTSYYPVLSANAFNFWILLFGYNHAGTSDQIEIFGIQAKLIGLTLFLITFILALLPLIKLIILNIKKKVTNGFSLKDWQLIFLSTSLSFVVFFFFNTQMHERYANAAIIFAFVYALLSRKYLYYIGISLAYLLNLMHVFNNVLPFNINLLISPLQISILYLLTLIYGYYHLYHLMLSKQVDNKTK